jgi:hypothetical protein
MKMNRTIIDALNNDPATYNELCGLLDINDGWRQLLAAVTEGIYGVRYESISLLKLVSS